MSSTNKLPLAEMFGPTIQGEGENIGKVCYFLRLYGCGSLCSWCDTSWAREIPEDSWTDVDEIAEKLLHLVLSDMAHPALSMEKLLVITGGNPFVHNDGMPELIGKSRMAHFKVQVETQGTVYQEWAHLVDAITISPKDDWNADVIWKLSQACPNTSLKPVVFWQDDVADQLNQVYMIHTSFPDIPLTIQVGTRRNQSLKIIDDYRRITELACQYYWKAPVRILPQAHVLLWGDRRGV